MCGGRGDRSVAPMINTTLIRILVGGASRGAALPSPSSRRPPSAAGKTETLKVFSKQLSFTYTKADGTVSQGPPAGRAGAGRLVRDRLARLPRHAQEALEEADRRRLPPLHVRRPGRAAVRGLHGARELAAALPRHDELIGAIGKWKRREDPQQQGGRRRLGLRRPPRPPLTYAAVRCRCRWSRGRSGRTTAGPTSTSTRSSPPSSCPAVTGRCASCPRARPASAWRTRRTSTGSPCSAAARSSRSAIEGHGRLDAAPLAVGRQVGARAARADAGHRPGDAGDRAGPRGRRERLRRRPPGAPARHDRGDRVRRGLRGLLALRRRVRLASARARRAGDDPRLPRHHRPVRAGATASASSTPRRTPTCSGSRSSGRPARRWPS